MKVLAPIFLLAACGAQPAPEFFGAQRVDVIRDGRQYTVFQQKNELR